jgi:hypothetical protein
VNVKALWSSTRMWGFVDLQYFSTVRHTAILFLYVCIKTRWSMLSCCTCLSFITAFPYPENLSTFRRHVTLTTWYVGSLAPQWIVLGKKLQYFIWKQLLLPYNFL